MGFFGNNDSKIIADAKLKAQKNNAVYFFVGDEGKVLTVYEDRVAIISKPSVLANFSGNGEKTIYYCDCVGVQFKTSPSGCQRGFLQLETSSTMENTIANTFYSENSFVWIDSKKSRKSTTSNEEMEEVNNYIQEKIKEYKKQKNQIQTVSSISSADELKKFKELLDLGIISQEEFDAKKKQLLGL